MGFFTYRQAKQTKNEVRKLRAQQRAIEERWQAEQERETQLFQLLPPEGKEEFRAAQRAFLAKWQTFNAWKRTGKPGHEATAQLTAAKNMVFRKYDLIP
jgi:hypothetical protein